MSSFHKQKLELPSKMANIEIELVKTHLYETGSHYGQTFQSSLLGKNKNELWIQGWQVKLKIEWFF